MPDLSAGDIFLYIPGYIYWPSGSIGHFECLTLLLFMTFFISDREAQQGYTKSKSLSFFK